MNTYVVTTAGREATVEAEEGTSAMDIVMLAIEQDKLDRVGVLALVEGGEYVDDQIMCVFGSAIARKLEEAGLMDLETDGTVH